jgi:hypothetical protein
LVLDGEFAPYALGGLEPVLVAFRHQASSHKVA